MYRDPDDYEGSPTTEQQTWLNDVNAAQETCKAVIRSTVDTLIKSRRRVSANALSLVLEAVAEELNHDIAHSAESLQEEGFERSYTPYPDEHEKFIAQEHERLVDAFRPKSLDAAGLLRDALRPVATNPATWEGV